MTQGEIEDGLKLLVDAERLFEYSGYQSGLLSVYNAYAYYFKELKMGEDQHALSYAMKSVALAREIQDSRNLADALIWLTDIRIKQGQTSLALQAASEALRISEEHHYLQSSKRSASRLAELYESAGNSKQALIHFKKHTSYKDSLFNKENIEKIKEIELNHQYEEQRFTDSLQALKTIQGIELDHQKKINRSNLVKGGLISLIVVALVVVVFVLIAFRRKRKQALMLDQKNRQISDTLHEKELLIREIHHRVENNFQIISNLLDLQVRGIHDEKAQELAADGQGRVRSMALIHQKLYSNENLSVNMTEFVEQLVGELRNIRPDIAVVPHIDIPKDLNLDVDTAIPLGLIINELITNSFKYGFSDERENELNISLEKGTKEHILTVMDNGKGLPSDLDIEKSPSTGLRLVRRLSRQLNGRMMYSFTGGARFDIAFRETAA